MDHDDEPDAKLPLPMERLLQSLRTLGEPSEADEHSFERVMGTLRSCSVRDSHETLVDRALLAAPLTRQPGEGSLPEPDGISVSLQALALEQLLGRQRIASAVSGLTVALFLALVLWMASSNQVDDGSLLRHQGVHGSSIRRSAANEPLVRERSRTSAVRLPGDDEGRSTPSR